HLMFLVAFFVAGYAIQGATNTSAYIAETNFSNPNSFDITAGYIYFTNFTSAEQTYRWAGFYGTVAGNIVLRDSSGNGFYTWTLASQTGSFIYATTNSSTLDTDYFYAINASGGDLATVDTAYGYETTVTDSISNTYDYYATYDPPSLAGFVTNSTPVTSPNWTNYLLKMRDGTTNPTVTQELVWACEVNESQTSFESTTVDYQLLIPENEEPDDGQYSTTTYYFWLELI
ncbi:MAG: hypothetical protein GOU99_02550, partial [Candidatus Altiarchaeota archaeon]|nr:hypothetical protein [Candidatus Altiarchaeota archaeon]